MIEILLHSPGTCDQWPAHLPGARADCSMCHSPMVGGPARLIQPEHAHSEMENVQGALRHLGSRVDVVEQILSDAIPPQPGEDQERLG